MKEQMILVRITSPIIWKDQTLKAGDEIKVTRAEANYLGSYAVLIEIIRDEEIQTRVARAPETTSKRRK